MMFIEESLLDNNIKNIIKSSNGITNTDKATGKLLEASTVRPFVSLDASQVKDAKFSNLKLQANNPKLSEFDLESFHENLKRVKEILFKNHPKTTSAGGGENFGRLAAAGVETVEGSGNTPAASAKAKAAAKAIPITIATANAYASTNGNGHVYDTDDKRALANGFSNSKSGSKKVIKTNKPINETLLEFKQRIKNKLSKDKEKLAQNQIEIKKQVLAPLPVATSSSSSSVPTDEKILKKSEENLEDFSLIDIVEEEEGEHLKDDQIDIEAPLVINYNIEENLEEPFKVDHQLLKLKPSSELNQPIEIIFEQSSYEEKFLPENSIKTTDFSFKKNSSSNFYDKADYSPLPSPSTSPSTSPIKTISYKLEDLLGDYNQESDSLSPPRLLNGSFDLHNKNYHQGLSSSNCEEFEENYKPSQHFNKRRYSYPPEELIKDLEPPRKLKYNSIGNQDCYSDRREDELFRTDQKLAELCREYQMGFDFLSRLRRYIFPQAEDKRVAEGSRKRRADDVPPENNNPNLIKYRKVENNFPRIITQTFEDDMNPQRSQTVCQSHNMFQNNNTSDVSRERRSFKEKARNSLFSFPKKTQKIIHPGSFAQLEFSDDDDDAIIRNKTDRAFNAGSYINSSSKCLNREGFKKPATKSPGLAQVPTKKINEDRNQDFSSTSVFRSNVGCSTSSVAFGSSKPVASTHLESNNVVARKPCYADVLKYGKVGHSPVHQLIERTNSQFVSKATSSKSTHLTKPKDSSYLASKSRSIVQHQKEIDERDTYNKLLQAVAPHLYAKENRFQTSSRRNSLAPAFPKGRRSLTTNIKPSAIISLEDDEDVSLPGDNHLPLSSTLNKKRWTTKVINLDDSDSSEVTEVVNLDDDVSVSSSITHLRKHFQNEKAAKESKKNDLPFVEPINSLKDCLKFSPHLEENWLDKFKNRWECSRERRLKELLETTKENEQITAERKAAEVKLQEKFREFHIVDPNLIIVDDFAEPEEEPEVTSLTAEQDEKVKAAIYGPPDQILVSKFNMNITRRDIHTLLNQNWLNDEVINFYMNLLMERGDLKHESHNYPTVYAMNTFFVPRLLQSGHSGVRRWTRKIDIFSKEVIPVPVHVGGVHWCMAIIHLKNRSIKYYDSMGTPNPTVLKALEKYLQDESMDKRKQPFDTSDFVIESVRDVPRQMNGSDCGVFSCMFAEYITRNKEITFGQNEMVYFRNKMILEIVQGELLR